jgi:hypothetical protein
MRDKLVHLEIAIHVICHEARQLRPALHTPECASLPHAARHKLERTRGDFLARGRDADDDALAPALVARFERGAHDVDVARAVEGVVAAAVRHLDEFVLDALFADFSRVDEIRGAEFLGP